MNCRTQVIAAAGIGYLLGRQRKLRWGLALAAAAAAGRISGPGDILQRGVKALTSAPELGGLANIGAPLVAAGKEAARAAVTGQIDSVTGKLRDRAEGLRRPGGGRQAPGEPPQEPDDDEPERRAPAARRRSRAAREDREDVYEEEPPAERRRGGPQRQAAERDDADDEEYDEPPEDDDAEMAAVGRSRPDVGSRAPVHRRGR